MHFPNGCPQELVMGGIGRSMAIMCCPREWSLPLWPVLIIQFYTCKTHKLNFVVQELNAVASWRWISKLQPQSALGVEGLKNLTPGSPSALAFQYFRQFMGQTPFVTFAPRLYNSYNHSQAPGPHMWPSKGRCQG